MFGSFFSLFLSVRNRINSRGIPAQKTGLGLAPEPDPNSEGPISTTGLTIANQGTAGYKI